MIGVHFGDINDAIRGTVVQFLIPRNRDPVIVIWRDLRSELGEH